MSSLLYPVSDVPLVLSRSTETVAQPKPVLSLLASSQSSIPSMLYYLEELEEIVDVGSRLAINT